MFNRITNHCKTRNHYLLLLIGVFVANISFASSQLINVYLKLKPHNEIYRLIKEFNQFLEEKKIFSTYHITPYLQQHPLHVTLYLAAYPNEMTPIIIKQTKSLAKQAKQMPLFTAAFIANNKNYVMLSVINNSQLQNLSNKTAKTLAQLRDKKASIPTWAAQDLKRKLAFNQYGSPSVGEYFNPHFSIFQAQHLNKKDNAHLSDQLQKLMLQFTNNHATSIYTLAEAIGVGISDEQGQIITELKSFSLS